MSPAVAALLVAGMAALPGITLFAVASGNGAARWPWTLGLVVSAALGVTVSALVGIALGVIGAFGLGTAALAVAGVSGAILAAGRFRVARPFGPAPRKEAALLAALALLALALFPGRPFEMLVGGQDATTYFVSGVAISRQGSLELHDPAADVLGPERMREIYPLFGRRLFGRAVESAKYQGFYYWDRETGTIVSQAFHFLPALIAIGHSAFGLSGAFATNPAIAIVALLAVFQAGIALVGRPAAAVGAGLLALCAIEVWAARYPVAEIALQMLFFAGFASLLRGGRLGEGIAAFLLGATLFAKVEAGLLAVPVGLTLLVGCWRRSVLPGRTFWIVLSSLGFAALAYWLAYPALYVSVTFDIFTHRLERLSTGMRETGWLLPLGLVVAAAAALLLARGALRRPDAGRLARRGLGATVALLLAYGYWIRPWVPATVYGHQPTLVWLSWYLSPPVLVAGGAGLAVWIARELRPSRFLVLATMLVFSLVFLEYTFVALYHIYLTRRFVPLIVPTFCLAAGYLIFLLADRGKAAAAAAGTATLVGLSLVIERGAHLYDHREYRGITAQFESLARRLGDADLVILGDRLSRNVFGPTLDLVLGVPTAAVTPESFPKLEDWIGQAVAAGGRVAALTHQTELEATSVPHSFDFVEEARLELDALERTKNEFPDEIREVILTVRRYEWGLFDHARDVVCRPGIQVLGRNRPLVRSLRRLCPEAASGSRAGWFVEQSEAATWAPWLEAHGARFVRRARAGGVLFTDVSPQAWQNVAPIPSAAWRARASANGGEERLAFDGRDDTRWGSGGPQRPGMRFTIELPSSFDVAWVRLRGGRFPWDRPRGLELQTSADGAVWERRASFRVDRGLVWQDGVAAENDQGDHDLWIGARGVRFVRLVNRGGSSRYDWSIAEVVLEGRPAED